MAIMTCNYIYLYIKPCIAIVVRFFPYIGLMCIIYKMNQPNVSLTVSLHLYLNHM